MGHRKKAQGDMVMADTVQLEEIGALTDEEKNIFAGLRKANAELRSRLADAVIQQARLLGALSDVDDKLGAEAKKIRERLKADPNWNIQLTPDGKIVKAPAGA
jgi:hypothetical protein